MKELWYLKISQSLMQTNFIIVKSNINLLEARKLWKSKVNFLVTAVSANGLALLYARASCIVMTESCRIWKCQSQNDLSFLDIYCEYFGKNWPYTGTTLYYVWRCPGFSHFHERQAGTKFQQPASCQSLKIIQNENVYFPFPHINSTFIELIPEEFFNLIWILS